MNNADQFYSNLHTADANYSAGDYHIPSLLASRIVRHWASDHRHVTPKMLDVGCGKGLFLRDFTTGIKRLHGIQAVQATGIDLVQSPGNHFSEICPDFKFIQQNLDGQTLPFADQSFDFLSCNHVLEHVFETEKLVKEFRRVLQPQGLGLISVPNTAAWVNRLLFLFAGQPLGTELGTEKVTYGFWPASMQPKLAPFMPSGHIRDFTPRGLRDLTTHCGFQTLGWWKQSKGPVARMGYWAGRNIAILLKPA